MNIKPIEGWRRAWRWFSVQAMVLAGALQGAWLVLTPAMQASIPQNIVQAITLTLLVLGVVGRLVDQTPKDAP